MSPKNAGLFALVILALASATCDMGGPEIRPPEIIGFYAWPDIINRGESTELHCVIFGADSAFISGNVGDIQVQKGEWTYADITVSPAISMTYTLTVSNKGGTASASCSVSVNQTR